VAVGIGKSTQRSDALLLTLEMNTLGFRALTCLTFMVRNTPLSSSHAVHAAFSVGVYINLLNSYVHSKEVSWNHKYMYTYTYMKYIYIKMKLSLSGILPQLLNFFLRILFFKLRSIGVKKMLYCV
jgi:hypothetical protein